jgi:hypothetical protein
MRILLISIVEHAFQDEVIHGLKSTNTIVSKIGKRAED